ncbi:MAG: GNAT family N-acetyltransferase [Ancalomicrobiaceae bacterium]|nr:GNAT family N-acetyltransferase [Ancalomicrobiaceae bacterium]
MLHNVIGNELRREASRPAGEVEIRPCLPADVASIQAIYAEAVATGTASFELAAPTIDEMVLRRDRILAGGFPYLVAVEAGAPTSDGGALLGYAYAGPYRPRPAYRFTVENSIYVAPSAQGRGIGSRLMAELIAACETIGARQMIAVIGDSANEASIRLHTHCGFAAAGVLKSVGFKHGRWLDSVLMQRPIGRGDAANP